MAIGPDGVGLVAWDDSADGASQYDTSAGRLVVVRPDGEIGQVQPIGARAAVGVDGTGRVVAMWASRRSEYAYPDLYVAEAGAPGAPFGRPTVLTERFNLHSPLHLSVNARGDAVAMWTVWNGSGSHVEATARKAGEAFAPPRRACPAAAHRCEGLRLELAPNGSVTGTWSEGTRASRRVAEGLIGRPLRLGAIPAPRSYGLRAPVETLDVANDGSAVVAWAARQGVAAAARTGRRWRSLGAIARGSAYEPAAAALGHGRSVVVWREQQRDKWLVVARAIGRSGHAGRRHVLSRISDLYRGGVPRPSTTFVPPVVGADARGRAVALWKRYDGRLEMAVKR